MRGFFALIMYNRNMFPIGLERTSVMENLSYFVVGIFFGNMLTRAIDVIKAIWANAKEATDSRETGGVHE